MLDFLCELYYDERIREHQEINGVKFVKVVTKLDLNNFPFDVMQEPHELNKEVFGLQKRLT
jgi:hypothetical protein